MEMSTLELLLMDLGFVRGTIEVPSLKIELNTGRLFGYFEANDVHGQHEQINRALGLPVPEYQMVLGFCNKIRTLDESGEVETVADYVIIMTPDLLSEKNVALVGGHEFGHLLWDTDNTNLVYQQARDPTGLRKEVADTEDFAQVCGWVAVVHSGLSLDVSGKVVYVTSDNAGRACLKAKDAVERYFL